MTSDKLPELVLYSCKRSAAIYMVVFLHLKALFAVEFFRFRDLKVVTSRTSDCTTLFHKNKPCLSLHLVLINNRVIINKFIPVGVKTVIIPRRKFLADLEL
jgi:hypothetical protein